MIFIDISVLPIGRSIIVDQNILYPTKYLIHCVMLGKHICVLHSELKLR